MAYVWFAFISLVWGGSFILMKKGAVWFSPTAVGAWRVIGGAAILALVWWRSSQPLVAAAARSGGAGFRRAVWFRVAVFDSTLPCRP